MEEEMQKIEEEFAFQDKWISIFKRGKFIFQEMSESLILKIITKMEAKAFFNLLRTGKWMLLLCEENRRNLLIPFEISRDDHTYQEARLDVSKKEKNQQLRKIIRSKYHFFLSNICYEDFMPFLEDLYSTKEATNHFRRECWNIEFLRIDNLPINISIINHLQPIILEISMDQNGPLPENFNIPAQTKDFFVDYASISDFDFYKEIERFGLLPSKVTFRRKGHLKLDELFSTLKKITQERHLHHPLQFLTYRRESRSRFKIFESWPMMNSFFPSTNFFYFIIIAKSDIGVSIIHLYRFAYIDIVEQLDVLQIMEIKSFDEWKEFTESEIVDKNFDLKAGQICEKSDKLLAKFLEVFSTQVASKFFEGGKLVYPPLAPEPAPPEFVEFLKKFEDFDIQPEKMEPHKPKWKKTEKLPELPRKLPKIHSNNNNRLIEAREVIKLRKFWMDFLQKKKFILQQLPEKNVLDIARRIEYTRFPLLFSSTKWINELIQNSASNFRIHGGRSNFSKNRIYRKSSDFKEALKSLEFYYLNDIKFNDFFGDTSYLKEVLQWVRERKIFVKQISLGCPLIQELFESFARGPELLLVDNYTTLPAPVNFSPQLKTIAVNVVFFKRDQVKELIEEFTGIEQEVIWFCDSKENINATITYQLELHFHFEKCMGGRAAAAAVAATYVKPCNSNCESLLKFNELKKQALVVKEELMRVLQRKSYTASTSKAYYDLLTVKRSELDNKEVYNWLVHYSCCWQGLRSIVRRLDEMLYLSTFIERSEALNQKPRWKKSSLSMDYLPNRLILAFEHRCANMKGRAADSQQTTTIYDDAENLDLLLMLMLKKTTTMK